MTRIDGLPELPPRAADSHKGDYGHVLMVGGSRGMSGAIALAGMACLRAGAGLVSLAVPEPCVEPVAAFEPCYMIVPLPADPDGRVATHARARIEAALQHASVLACGPGLGQSDALVDLVRWIYATAPQPAVFDADALNALARHRLGLAAPGGPRIITPHPGEFRRLLGDRSLSRAQCLDRATSMARQHGLVVVLKGHQTQVTDGATVIRNGSGNPGMATAGSGDVLTGIIAGLAAQQLAPFAAARLGVYLHGCAGDIAAARRTQPGMIARDLVEFLPEAWRQTAAE